MKFIFFLLTLLSLMFLNSCKKDNIKTEFDISENQTNWRKYVFDEIDRNEESPNDFFVIGISDISFVNNQIGYMIGFVAYHEAYAQVYKTIDGGLNWTKFYYWEGGAATFGSSIHFFNEKNGYMIGEGMEPSVFKIENNEIKSLIIDSLSNDYPYKSPMFFIDSLNGFIKNKRTIDGGNSWHNIFNEVFFNINDYYFLNKTTGICCSRDGVILKTNDFGSTWDTIYQNNDCNFNCVFMIDSQTIFAGGNKIIKSIDGGNNWYDTYNNTNINDIKFVNDMVGFAAESNTSSGKILKTVNAGETWEQNYYSNFMSFNSLFVVDNQTIVAAGRQGNENKEINHVYIIKTTTQGK